MCVSLIGKVIEKVTKSEYPKLQGKTLRYSVSFKFQPKS